MYLMNILEYENYQEKISHGNPLFPYITYLCSIPLDFSYVPIHWHDEMELIYIKKGHGIITVDFTQYQVSAGTHHPGTVTLNRTIRKRKHGI